MKKLNKDNGNMKIYFIDEYDNIYKTEGRVIDKTKKRKGETYKNISKDMKIKIIKNDQVIYQTKDKKKKGKFNRNEDYKNSFKKNNEIVKEKVKTINEDNNIQKEEQVDTNISSNQSSIQTEVNTEVKDVQTEKEEIITVVTDSDTNENSINLDDTQDINDILEEQDKVVEKEKTEKEENKIENKAKKLHEETKNEIKKILDNPKNIVKTKRKYLDAAAIIAMGEEIERKKVEKKSLPEDVLNILASSGVDLPSPTSYDKYEEMAAEYGYDDCEKYQKIRKQNKGGMF